MNSSCNLCQQKMESWLTMPLDPKKNIISKYDKFLHCDACDLGAMSPLPEVTEIEEFYKLEKYYTQGEGHFRDYDASVFDYLLSKVA